MALALFGAVQTEEEEKSEVSKSEEGSPDGEEGEQECRSAFGL